MPTIDADAHVVESEHTWDFMEPGDQKYRPTIVMPRDQPGRSHWFIDGKLRGLGPFPVLTAQEAEATSQRLGRNVAVPQEARDMENVEARLRHMDQLGIDVQVLHPTIFIEQVADRPDVEVAICKGYNRWLAHIWEQGGGRLRWSCPLPLLDMSAALEELDFAQAHGSCAVLMRGIEGDRLHQDPYFFPMYEKASRLNIPILVHIGNANPTIADFFAQRNPSGFSRFRLPSVAAFHAIVMTGLPLQFPQLRIGFVEQASQWIPYVIQDLRRRFMGQGKPFPENLLRDYRMYVSCETDDDVSYVLKYAGDDNLVIGTDYGHTDQSSEVEALRILKEKGGITHEQYRKITDDNPRALYGM